ncbi:MAG: dihydroorotase [Coriobacteriia bacterium]|nr:dihydroorotase [Coriobacteriia bacterium]
MTLLLRNALCVDPSAGLAEPTLRDLLIEGLVIKRIEEPGLIEVDHAATFGDENDIEVIDLAGKTLLPGLFDMHVHLRDPGQEYKEDIYSGRRAAAKGGFTAILAMPNTNPVIDNGAQVSYVLDKAAKLGGTRVYTSGALTAGQKGESLSEMASMKKAGAVAFTDDGKGVQDSGIMRLIMEYAASIEAPILTHSQVNDLVLEGQVNEGVVSTRLGMAGWPAAGEEIMIARDIMLAELTGAALHIQHVSTAGGLQLIKAAKAKGLPVTCEVTPHHLFLDEEAIDIRYDTNLKVNPPLRTKADCDALLQGLLDGDIDCLVTDHAPHADHEKSLEFELAPFGMTGLETALSLMITRLIATETISWAQLVEVMGHTPRRILGIMPVSLAVGSQADLTIIDPQHEWQVNADKFASRSKNSPFINWQLTGKATDVLVGGAFTLKDGEIV